MDVNKYLVKVEKATFIGSDVEEWVIRLRYCLVTDFKANDDYAEIEEIGVDWEKDETIYIDSYDSGDDIDDLEYSEVEIWENFLEDNKEDAEEQFSEQVKYYKSMVGAYSLKF